MKLSVGKAIAATAGLQTAIGIYGSWPIWRTMLNEGLFNTVDAAPERQAAFWLVAFGQFGMLLGFLADWAERTAGRLPGCFGWSVIGFVAIAAFFVPTTLLWLLLAPAIAAIVRAKRTKRALWTTTAADQTPR